MSRFHRIVKRRGKGAGSAEPNPKPRLNSRRKRRARFERAQREALLAEFSEVEY